MPQRQEISSLLDAEKKAAEKIEEARKRKAKRLKEAQLEARTEIEQLKNDREADYKVKENEVSLETKAVHSLFSSLFCFVDHIFLANWKPKRHGRKVKTSDT